MGAKFSLKQLIKKLNSQKINDPVKKWANELNRAFSKEEVQMDNKHHKGNADQNHIKTPPHSC
jgi:hypothetical protein